MISVQLPPTTSSIEKISPSTVSPQDSNIPDNVAVDHADTASCCIFTQDETNQHINFPRTTTELTNKSKYSSSVYQNEIYIIFS